MSRLKRFLMGRRWFLLIPLSIITVMVTIALLAEFLTPTYIELITSGALLDYIVIFS